MSRSLLEPRWTLALGLVLSSVGCGISDNPLAPNNGRVRFVIDSGSELYVPLASESATVMEAGPDGLHSSTEGDSSGSGSGDGTDTDNSGPGSGDDGTVEPDRPDVYPSPYIRIKSANVTFASILARNLDGVLENVEMDLPVTVDVLTLETGRQIQLPEGELPVGTYDQVVVVMTELHVVLWDDTEVTVTPPGGGWTAVVMLCPPVDVEEGGTSTVALTLEVRNALFFDGNRFHFQPRFRHQHGCPILDPIPLEPVIQ